MTPWAVGTPVSTEAGSLPARMTQRPRVAARLGALCASGDRLAEAVLRWAEMLSRKQPLLTVGSCH